MIPASHLPSHIAPTTPSPRKRKRPSNAQVIDLTSPSASTPSKSTPRRRKPKNADDATPSPEKRLKRYRDHPPQSVMVKHERVMTQRMFLVERSGRANGALEEDFSVLGSTGNVYIVNVSMVPTYTPPLHLFLRSWWADCRCTCPDFLKNQVHCKHILFVFLKVLKLPDPLWYQAAFLTSVSSPVEVLETNVRNWRRFSQRWRIVDMLFQTGLKNTLKVSRVGMVLPLMSPMIPDENRLRGIGIISCVLRADIVLSVSKILRNRVWRIRCFVRQCAETISIRNVSINGRGVSDRKDPRLLAVFDTFRRDLTVVYCRTRWDEGKGKTNGGEEPGEEGYMNLGKMVGASPVRGTTTI